MTDPTPPPTREERLAALGTGSPDVVVVGGGITGAGVALDLAARGLSVVLLEQDDWAAHTSSASSRLVHGGLRYLEHGELGLVRESCLERAWLLDAAAGLVWPESFAFPLHRGDRVGPWKLRAGLWLYTLLSIPRRLGWPRVVGRSAALRRVPSLEPEGLRGAGLYMDAATDDARLAWATVRTAMEHGATCLSRARVDAVEPQADGVRVDWVDRLQPGPTRELRARAAVLCGGPFTDALRTRSGLEGRWIAPTRGSHIVVDRGRLPTEGAVIFTSKVDGRAMFLIPTARRTVIGTTDLDDRPDRDPSVTPDEVDYLLSSANGISPSSELSRSDVISTWSGLRPLLAAAESDPSARSREERVECDGSIYTIAGGKLTGFRSMAEGLGRRVARDLGRGRGSAKSPTRRLRLWGGLASRVGRPDWSSPFGASGLSPEITDPGELGRAARRRRYGAYAEAVERRTKGSPELDAETLLGEVDWAVEQEDALGVTDFLMRRTDVGYGPLDELDRTAPMVLDRMAGLLGWDAERRAAEERELGEVLERMHGWRGM